MVRDEADRETLGAEAAGAAHTVKVLIAGLATRLNRRTDRLVSARLREIVVDDNVDTFDVNPTPNEVRGHENARLVVLEFFVLLDTAEQQATNMWASDVRK